jgi:O-glycosyl hydrolase
MERRVSFWILLLMCLASTSATGDRLVERVVITVDRSARHQTILGWGADQSPTGEQMSTMLDPYPARLFDQLYDDAVDLFGFNSIRVLSHHHPPDRLWEPFNDNADPLIADRTRFNYAWLDLVAQRDLLPLKQRVEANGEPFHIYLSMGNFGAKSTPAWLQNSPAEWAEYLFTAVKYLKEQYAIDVDSVAVINEPLFAASTYANAAFIAPIVKALGARLAQAGYATRIQFPEAFDPRMAWQLHIAPLRNDNDFWAHVGLITYHKYGVDDPYRASILELAKAKGIPVGQTEQDGLLATVQGLYEDLVIGGVSRWGASFTMVGFGAKPDRSALYSVDADGHSFTRHERFWSFRQIMKYVRPGAVRIDASSRTPGVRALAFERQNETTAILISGAAPTTAEIYGLAPGLYGVSRSVYQSESQEMAPRTVSTGQALTLELPANTVLTVYPRAAANRPPVVTGWKSSARFLKRWASETRTTLSASATDSDGDTLTFAWRTLSAPQGADVAFSVPQGASTSVSGLTVPGEYVFAVDVSDGPHKVTREVFLRSHAANAAPIIHSVHYRLPDVLVWPASSTGLRSGVVDIDGNSTSVTWSVISQPGGANVVIATPSQIASDVSGLTAIGDYVFRVTARDGVNTSFKDLSVKVYPPTPSPVIKPPQPRP